MILHPIDENFKPVSFLARWINSMIFSSLDSSFLDSLTLHFFQLIEKVSWWNNIFQIQAPSLRNIWKYSSWITHLSFTRSCRVSSGSLMLFYYHWKLTCKLSRRSSRIGWEYKSTKHCRSASFITSTSRACVQYESWTAVNERPSPSCCIRIAVSSMWVESRLEFVSIGANERERLKDDVWISFLW